MSEKPKRHLKFTFFNENVGPAPQITLNYTPTDRPSGPQRVTFSANKSSKSSNQPKKPPPTGLARILNDLVKKVAQKDTQRIFAAPVTDDIAPRYSEIIKHPIDLSVIRTKVHDDEYENLAQFRDDMYLMFKNCVTYNPPGTYVYREGKDLLNFFRRELKQVKNQLRGEPHSHEVSGTARTAAGREALNITREINGVDIPVVFDRKEKAKGEVPSFPARPDAGVAFYYVPHPPGEYDTSDKRFEVACDLIGSSNAMRKKLKLLKDNFPPFILEDAVKKISGVDKSYDVNMEAVDAALARETDFAGGIAVGEAPIGIEALEALANECPELPLALARAVEGEKSEVHEGNLRLMLFYNNCLKFWRRSGFNTAKRKVIATIKNNIVKIAKQLRPVVLVKEKQNVLVVQHIVRSSLAGK